MLLTAKCRWEPYPGLCSLGLGLISSLLLQQPVRQGSLCQWVVSLCQETLV